MKIQIKKINHIAKLTLANPEKRNILDLEMSRNLKVAVEQVCDDSGVKAILLTSEGSAFCGGGALDELLEAREQPELLHEIYSGFLAVAKCPIPTVGAIHGPAVGAGMNLALACDVRIVTPNAKFDTRFTQLGIHSGGGHTWLLQRYLNWEQSVSALIFGKSLQGAEAVDAGLALECVEEQELEERCLSFCDSIRLIPRELIEETKKSLALASHNSDHDDMISHEFSVQAASLRSTYAGNTLNNLFSRIKKTLN